MKIKANIYRLAFNSFVTGMLGTAIFFTWGHPNIPVFMVVLGLIVLMGNGIYAGLQIMLCHQKMGKVE